MTDEQSADTAAPLDALLVQAATGPMRRLTPDLSTLRWAAGLARHPEATTKRLAGLVAELARVVVGESDLEPHPKDRRFKDAAWAENPFLRRLVQGYLATGATVDDLLAGADLSTDDAHRVRFLLRNLVDAGAPSNLPLLNPASAKAAIDTAGMNLLRGGGQFLRDMATSPRIPEMVDTSGYRLGENLAATPGSVVLRTEVLELIQYAPQTDEVGEVPILIVPPTINKFYAVDLAPDRSLVEHAVRAGNQTFLVSWRNPDARHRDWNFETYVEAILEALTTVEEITGSEQTVLGGICSGGILSSITAAYLAGTGQLDRLRAMVLAVTVIDTDDAGATAAMVTPQIAEVAKAKSRRDGYLDGRALAEVFAWLRPNDLVWNYWVNNYLLGKKPPAFDILAWNADTTRMTAGLHADFVDMSMANSLTRAGEVVIKGVPIDLSAVDLDAYVVAGIADHITPWEACYQATQMLGGTTQFVLSSSGHIAALVNPPGNPRASFRTAEENPPTAAAWLAAADLNEGTWWTDVTGWLEDRCGARVPAPEAVGSQDYPAGADAPGTYVFDK